jgi:hypothetical protein
MAPNGTRFGDWLLNTADNRFSPVGDTDGGGRDELLVTSPWGIGLLELSGGTLTAPLMAPNGTRFGGWLLNTADNFPVTLADVDGDGRAELVITSPWGLGILKRSGATFTSPMMAPNGTRFGGWLLNTLDNRVLCAADFDGDGARELLVTSPWGMGMFKLSGSTMTAPFMKPNGTRLGGWLLNTATDHFDAVADFNGDGCAEILVGSPWGVGVLRQDRGEMTSLAMVANGTRCGEWLLNTLDNRFEVGEQTLRMHVKVLTNPTIPVERMVEAMQQVYEAVGIRVQRASTETLNLPTLTEVDVGACPSGSTTAEQDMLFANRANAWGKDVVVYFVRSTIPAFNGCAAHPAGRPGAVVASIASEWTLGHEVGHVLGLPHVNDNNRLMTGNGTRNITNLPPDLVTTEVNTMRFAELTFET